MTVSVNPVCYHILKYCAALANEGGGKVILGVTDRRPRQITGTRAFTQPERTRAGLIEKLRLKVDVDEFCPSEGSRAHIHKR